MPEEEIMKLVPVERQYAPMQDQVIVRREYPRMLPERGSDSAKPLLTNVFISWMDRLHRRR
jgi:hypothetical protein